MPLHRWIGRAGGVRTRAVAVGLLLACVPSTPAHALRVVTWNLWQYPSTFLSTRQPHFRTVMAHINADVLIAQELNSAAGADSFLVNVLDVVQPGEWAGASTWINLGGEGGAVFYKPAKVSVGTPTTVATAGPRDVLQILVTPVGYAAAGAKFRLYSVHFKAGNTTADSDTRQAECNDLRNFTNTLAAGTNLLLGGDTNFYGGTSIEGGYARLTESQVDNDGRFKDPLVPAYVTGSGSWHDVIGPLWVTQSTCNTGCLAGFATGGMDDRFDLWLSSYSMQDGEGLDYLPVFTLTNGAYVYQYGNDGTKLNTDVNAGGTNGAVPIAVANALHDASDHLPVVITLQVPAKVVASGQLNFGSVIVGGTANQDLAVSNGAAAPADELSYTLTAPAGFTAPGGSFAANAGAAANNHSIGMSTASIGPQAGTLTVNSDDVDLPTANVSLSGTVLDHAAASLDSGSVQVAADVDFGDHGPAQFSDQAVRVHNYGYDALQARLSVNGTNIVGGDGRFSIVGGFSPALLAGTGQTWNVHFNDTGATLDQEYTATLTFTSADEALPGSTAATDLVVSLRAKPISSATDVPCDACTRPRDLPKTLAFYPPSPNPLTSETVFGYDLPAAAPVSLAIYDLGGRRVVSLASGTQQADRHHVRWDARSESGARVPPGLYFARFATPGLIRVARLIVLS